MLLGMPGSVEDWFSCTRCITACRTVR